MKSQPLLGLFGMVTLATVAYTHSGVETRDFLCIVICETILAALTAWGIDVANYCMALEEELDAKLAEFEQRLEGWKIQPQGMALTMLFDINVWLAHLPSPAEGVLRFVAERCVMCSMGEQCLVCSMWCPMYCACYAQCCKCTVASCCMAEEGPVICCFLAEKMQIVLCEIVWDHAELLKLPPVPKDQVPTILL